MSALIKTKADSHYYRATGEPVHEVLKADGVGTRPTDIRDARKQKLLPSVTTVLKVWPKEALVNWRIEQAILSASTLPRLQDEPLDKFIERVVVDMDRERDEAAEAGKVIHSAMASRVANGKWPEDVDPKWFPFFTAWEPWVVANLAITMISESVVVNEREGYAGCVDWVGATYLWGEAVLDFKNQAVKGKPKFYDTWAMQLVAYDACLKGDKRNSLVSVVLDRLVPHEPYVKVWDDAEAAEAQDNFNACLDFWKAVNNYNPAQP